VVLDHRNDEFLADLVQSVRMFCPEAEIGWYDSGPGPAAGSGGAPEGVVRLPASRPLEYAKVTPFFLDLLEWQAEHGHRCVVNLETDMAFIAPGFEAFLRRALAGSDHLAADVRPEIAPTSRWRPYRSLRPELAELTEILDVETVGGCFSPGQAFTIRFATAYRESPFAPRLRDFVERNQRPDASFSLQEVLLPTLAAALGLRTASYGRGAEKRNRYRPYHSARSVREALGEEDVHFVHPIRRDGDDAARRQVRDVARAPVS